MYLLYFFELKDICSSLPNAFLASRLNHECLYWTWSHCKKIYFIFSSLLRPMVYKRVLMALLHSRPEIPQCSTIWLRISNLKRIRLHRYILLNSWCSSVFNLENMRQAYPTKHVDPKNEKRSNVSLISHHSVLLSIFLLTTCKKDFFRDLKINNGWHLLIFF